MIFSRKILTAFLALLLIAPPPGQAAKVSSAQKSAAKKQFSIESSKYFFNQIAMLKSVSFKILEKLPPEKKVSTFNELPVLFLDKHLGMTAATNDSLTKEVRVAGVVRGYDSGSLDVKPGDIVLAFNGKPVKKEKEIHKILEKLGGAQTVQLKLRRGIQELNVEIPILKFNRRVNLRLSGARAIKAHPDHAGHLFFTPPFMDYLENQDELAFILAYYMSMKVQGNLPTRYDKKVISQSDLLDQFLKAEIFGSASLPFGYNWMSEKKEIKAQQSALELMQKAGFSSEAGSRLWKRLAVDEVGSTFETNGFIPRPSAKKLILLERQKTGNSSLEVTEIEMKEYEKKLNAERVHLALDRLIRVQTAGYRILHFMTLPNKKRRFVLPITLVNPDKRYREVFGLNNEEGVLAGGVLEGLVQNAIDIQRGDLITRLNGKSVDSVQDISEILDEVETQLNLSAEIKRNGQALSREIPLYSVARRRNFIVESETGAINAFADLRGRVMITPGMLRFVQSDDELAAVLGHEIAHHERKHVHKGVVNNTLASVAGTAVAMAVGSTVPGLDQFAGSLTASVVASPYSKSMEKEADDYGLSYMTAAGYSGAGAYAVWERFAVLSPSTGEGSFAATHPPSVDRFLALRQKIEGSGAVIKPVSADIQLGSSLNLEKAALPKADEDSPSVRSEFVHQPLPEEEREIEESDFQAGLVLDDNPQPESVGILEAGVAEKIKIGILTPKAVGPSDVFSPKLKEITWYCFFDSTGQMKNSFFPKYFIEWYKPNGDLLTRKNLKPRASRPALMDSKLELKQPLHPSWVGRWRVKVFKKKKLVDDRYFYIQ